MSYTPYNAPLLSPLLGDKEAATLFGVQAEIDSMVRFESALATAQCQMGMITAAHEEEIKQVLASMEFDLPSISVQVAKDGMAVPAFVRQVRARLQPETQSRLHLHCTSQDVIDSCAMMKMRDGYRIFIPRLEGLISSLEKLDATFGANVLMGFTRMQAALPINASDRIGDWKFSLVSLLSELSEQKFPLQLGGPVGRQDAYDGQSQQLAEIMASDLDLSAPARSWQTDRTIMVDIGHSLSKLTGSLGKLGTDVSLMAQMGEDHIKLSGGGSSSAMAHKNNPVIAESLVSIARFNAGLVSTLHNCLVHEQERSGSAWTLEWMIMPQLFVTTAAALRNANQLIGMVEGLGKPG